MTALSPIVTQYVIGSLRAFWRATRRLTGTLPKCVASSAFWSRTMSKPCAT